ncbi:hypothetical protein [Nitrolancea hollandica]|uniref:Uncharacterized protein n=1 Tax=Nitrolancea hollandica Lb TaxID=1129897 RepID=I4EKZ3_9BACT|nr:hypothetical protein [Nitrolancea hollandica]CCF85355.1 hypothetical protein NITHO_4870012 [Nitrolancea hollandica Lb]
MPVEGKPAPSKMQLLVIIVIMVSLFMICGRGGDGNTPAQSVSNKGLSQAYVYSDAAMKSAYADAGGNANTPLGAAVLDSDRTEAIKHLYHLATAEAGTFNGDTSGFYDWLVEYFRWEMGEPSRIDYDALLEHTKRQIQIATTQPKSDIGKRIRKIEASEDPLFPGGGPEVYWDYLFHPYWKLLFNATSMQYELASLEFPRLAEGYKMSQFTSDNASDFGAFLVQNGDILWAGMK